MFIPLDDIIVLEDRIRKEFKESDLLLLAESIWRVGLLHPIVLRDDERTLVAGGRRHKALTLLLKSRDLQASLQKDWGQPPESVGIMLDNQEVPYTRMSDLPEDELIEAELFENIHRADITWQERTAALSKLHQIRVAEKGPGTSAPGGEGGQTLKATAKEAFQTDTPTTSQTQAVSAALNLAEFLDDPMVAAAPDEKTAAKIVRGLREAKARADAANAMVGQKLSHTVIHGDVYDLIRNKDPRVKGMDIIMCDPPYGRDMHKHGFENRHAYDDSRDVFDKFCDELIPLLFSEVANAKAHMYIFCDGNDVERVSLATVASGWDVWQWPLIWDKGNVGSYGNAKQGPRHCYDALVYCWKGGMQPVSMFRDVIPINQQTDLPHPASKPVALYMDILKRSAVAGMRAFDPMVGGGTFFDACSACSLYGTGIEQMEQYYHMSLERVSKLS